MWNYADTLMAAGNTGTGTQGSWYGMVLPFVLMFAVFYFLLIRPQQRKQKTRTSMLSAIKKGDKVVTIGGIHGTIMELSDETVVLRVNDVTKLTFERSAINTISQSVPDKSEAKSEPKSDAKTDAKSST